MRIRIRVQVRENAESIQASSSFAVKSSAPKEIWMGAEKPKFRNSASHVFSNPGWQIARNSWGIAVICRLMRFERSIWKI